MVIFLLSYGIGINAGLLNYNFSGNSVQNRIGGNSHYAYLNLQSGLNIGAWRLRDNTTWSYNSSDSSSGSKNKWQHINTWLERDIIPLRSRLTLGDGYTRAIFSMVLTFAAHNWPQMTICYPIAKEDLPR